MHLKTTMNKICQIQESIQKVLYITFHLYEVQEWARLIYSDRSQNSGVSLEGGMDWKRHKRASWGTENILYRDQVVVRWVCIYSLNCMHKMCVLYCINVNT